MMKSLEQFKNYITEISTITISEDESYVDTQWLQSIIPRTIQTELEAIDYLYSRQDLITNFLKDRKSPFYKG